MKLTVVGSGAIGGTVGAYLNRDGIPVLMVDRVPEHVTAMRERGLTIEAFDETFTVPVRAALPEEIAEPLDVVLLAVKAQHTVEALQDIMPHLGPDSTVVSLQNGLCEHTIAGLIGPERTVGCFVNFSADYQEPGRITYGGPGSFYLGELNGADTERVRALQDVLRHFAPVNVTGNIWGYLWGKMGYANMLFATALADETMADVIDRYRELMVELAGEIYQVAEWEGVRPEPFDCVQPSLYWPRDACDPAAISRSLDELVARRRRDKKSKSGIWRDLAVRRRHTEVDQQIALAARIGARHGLSMPLTNRLVDMIHELEAGRRKMGWGNLEELEDLRKSLRHDHIELEGAVPAPEGSDPVNRPA